MAKHMKWRAWVVACLGASLGPMAAAQHEAPGETQPAVPARRPPALPIAPSAGPEAPKPTGPQIRDTAIPGLEDADFLIGASALRSEGTFLVEKRGSILRLPTGERVIVFHEDDKGKRERPMVLLPCRQLQQMEQMSADEPTVFVVTGQVFVYSSVNYLLPTLVRQAGETRPPPVVAEPDKAGDSDPGVQELIRQLEAQREVPRGPESKAMEARATAGEGTPLAEGLTVVRRRGRMVRLSGGDWALAFDSGTSGDVKLDRPLTLSPCLNLQRMESWAMRSGDSASFEVSGRVLAYQGRNYLIPTMFQVYPVSELEAKH